MRSIEATIKTAVISIFANKTRTLLTVLGIIIGIAAVIALLSVGQGAQQSILEEVQSVGSNTVNVLPIAGGGIDSFQSRSSFQQLASAKLDRKIIDLLDNKVTFSEIADVGYANTGSFIISYREKTRVGSVNGVNAAFMKVRQLEAESGRLILDSDGSSLRRVAVLGHEVYVNLFGESDAIGKKIKIGDQFYEVVGILEQKNGQFDSELYLPFETASVTLIGDTNPAFISVQVSDEELVDSTALKMEEALLDYYEVPPGDDPPFTIVTSQDILALTSSITSIFTSLLASIAGISLVVGGIGIMNIMLVSVSERTREIGLRKAVGAKQSAILAQFLTEAVVLTLIGGIIGIVLGISLGYLIGSVAGISVLLTLDAVVLATSVSVFIGIVFGFYPAYRAAQLNPIDALRYE